MLMQSQAVTSSREGERQTKTHACHDLARETTERERETTREGKGERDVMTRRLAATTMEAKGEGKRSKSKSERRNKKFTVNPDAVS